MSFPTDILGLFQPATLGPVTPDIWERLLRVDDTSQCYIDRVLFCKCKEHKKHEFLLIYVHHPTDAAKALLVVDRSHAVVRATNLYFRPLAPGSGIFSPSIADCPAQDRIYVTREDNKAEVTGQYKAYTTLCRLTFPSPSNITGNHFPPSVQQLCVLLQVVSKHAPLYNLYEHQCYWFANTVFDVLKKLCPTGEETCSTPRAHTLRSKYLGLKFEHQGSVEMLFEEYDRAWGEACEKMKQEEIGREKSRRVLIERGRDEGRVEREQLRADKEQLQAERARLKARLRTAL